jgi:hypothetical protein
MPRQSIQDFLIFLLDLFNTTIIPLIFGIAILFFIWNAARYFVFQGATEEGRDSARRLMFYGITAMVLMLSLWGIVRLTTETLGINRSQAPCPDFNPDCGRSLQGGRGGSGIGGGDRFFDLTNPGAGVQTDTSGSLRF